MLTFCRLAWLRGTGRNSSSLVRSAIVTDALPGEHLTLEPPTRVSVLTPSRDDLSHVVSTPTAINSFSYYVNKSKVLKNLVDLGVDLTRVERKPDLVVPILQLDFDEDVRPRLVFLNDYVPSERLGDFITRNPAFLLEDLDHMRTRINYLESKRFTPTMIQRLVTENPFWLMFSTTQIDKQLGYFQYEFRLSGNEVRQLAVAKPWLITRPIRELSVKAFTFKEEMGFTDEQLKHILLSYPALWIKNQACIIQRFNYVHHTMGMSHERVCRELKVLDCRLGRIRERNEFLKKLGMDQYEPTKPNYVSLTKLVEGTDAEFCFDVAKCTVSDYDLYLKTL